MTTYVISAGSEIPPGCAKLPDILGGVRVGVGDAVGGSGGGGLPELKKMPVMVVLGWVSQVGYRYRQRGGGSRKGGGALSYALQIFLSTIKRAEWVFRLAWADNRAIDKPVAEGIASKKALVDEGSWFWFPGCCTAAGSQSQGDLC